MSKIIDWNNPKEMISDHFSVHEALYLPTWDDYAKPTDEQKANILKVAAVMDKIRDLVNSPIIVHCWLRPEAYNKAIGGAKNSSHKIGLACDFHVVGKACDSVRELLLKYLDKFNIRMEDKPGSSWIHISCDWSEGKTRFFKP